MEFASNWKIYQHFSPVSNKYEENAKEKKDELLKVSHVFTIIFFRKCKNTCAICSSAFVHTSNPLFVLRKKVLEQRIRKLISSEDILTLSYRNNLSLLPCFYPGKSPRCLSNHKQR